MSGGIEGEPRFQPCLGLFKETLVLLFLAVNAVACPRHRFQAFYLNFFLAGQAETICTILEAF